MPELIETQIEIYENLEVLKSYLRSGTSDKEFAAELIRKGRVFASVFDGQDWFFGPSRFVGYSGNTHDIHVASKLDKAVDGRKTNPAISMVLGPILEPGDVGHRALDQAFLEFCNTMDITPENRVRKYWRMPDRRAPSRESNAYFESAYQRFCDLVLEVSGHKFTNFNEGVAKAWEDYKPRLRQHALEILQPSLWAEEDIGSGKILNAAIQAIEIQDSRANLTNNLVFWQNRYGHEQRAHKAFLESRTDPQNRRKLEQILFDLFRGDNNSLSFEGLNKITNGKYPLLAYLFYLRDDTRYMPILPTTYDKAFELLGIELVTRRNCSWDNYQSYNSALSQVADFLKPVVDQPGLSLIDAHSFCFLLIKLEDELKERSKRSKPKSGSTVYLGGRTKCIFDMKYNTIKTVVNANGQMVERKIKDKSLGMSEDELEKEITRLLDKQEDRCALTGIEFDYRDPPDDIQLKPSLDRIDSGGHYEKGNLQVVCRFVNFWKSAQDNTEFLRLLAKLRGDDDWNEE